MSHRKALFAAATVVAVLLAGVVAVGASVGLLDGGNGGVGELSASSAGQVATAPAAEPASASAADTHEQTFEVDRAGSVTLARTGSQLRVASVDPAAGWTWSTDQQSDDALAVELTDGSSVLVLHAELSADGSISARVDSPNSAPPPATGASSGDHEEEHRDEAEYEDHEDEERGHEDEEHEDEHHDDEHDYEGHDDDD